MKCIGLSQLLADSCLHYQTTITNGAFLGSLKQTQGQYGWTETSAKVQGEQALSFVLIHFQENENNRSWKIAVKAISGLHKSEQSLGLLWLTHGTVPLPRQPPSSADTKVAKSLCPRLCWGRGETSSPGCAQHIVFYLVCWCDNMLRLGLHRVSHCGQIELLSARSFRAIEHHQTCCDYPEVLGFVGVQMGWDAEPEPWPRRRESSWAILLEATGNRFPSWGRLARTDLESQNSSFFSEPKHWSRHSVWISWKPLF